MSKVYQVKLTLVVYGTDPIDAIRSLLLPANSLKSVEEIKEIETRC